LHIRTSKGLVIMMGNFKHSFIKPLSDFIGSMLSKMLAELLLVSCLTFIQCTVSLVTFSFL
jgi:hypothetical protein